MIWYMDFILNMLGCALILWGLVRLKDWDEQKAVGYVTAFPWISLPLFLVGGGLIYFLAWLAVN